MKEKRLPRIAKPMDESRYGFSEDDDLIEEALDELLAAHDSKDHNRAMMALQSLIEFILNKEAQHAPTDVEA